MDLVNKDGKTPKIPRTTGEKKEAAASNKETPLQRKMRGRDMVTEGIDLIVMGYKTYYGSDLMVDVSPWDKGMPDKVVIKPNFLSYIMNRGKSLLRDVFGKLGSKK